MSEPGSRTETDTPNLQQSVEDQLAAARRRIEECEAALEESEARFRNVIERNGDAIFVVADDGAIRYANATAGRVFGTRAEDLIGTPFGFPLDGGEITQLDVVVSGLPRVVEMRVTASTWDGARVRLVLLRDITEIDAARRERAAQAATHLAEMRLREIISQAPVAIAVLRGRQLVYDITNERYEELIGFRKVIGKTVRDALPELEGQGIYELLERVFATGEPYVGSELPLMIERRPGSVEQTYFSFVYHPLRDPDGSVSAVAIVASDVTPLVRTRKNVEALAAELEATNEQLEQAFQREREARAEAETANKAKSDFLATMSHELRTPLNAIGGYADLMLAEIRGPITDAQRLDLQRINRSQRHLLAVINDILNFAKVEAGRVQLNPVDISMNEALGELESLVAPQLLEKQITYDYQCCDPKYRAHADPERLQQILLNLLSNAVKFTPRGGRITVVCNATPTAMIVRVTDTGIGLPEDKVQSVFEPFVQLERGQRPDMRGTGLGLAISRDLARAMAGDLVVEATSPEGTTFALTLPRVRNA
jgi:PAS domain S-box-containing protein